MTTTLSSCPRRQQLHRARSAVGGTTRRSRQRTANRSLRRQAVRLQPATAPRRRSQVAAYEGPVGRATRAPRSLTLETGRVGRSRGLPWWWVVLSWHVAANLSRVPEALGPPLSDAESRHPRSNRLLPPNRPAIGRRSIRLRGGPSQRAPARARFFSDNVLRRLAPPTRSSGLGVATSGRVGSAW
jgi:hypothetical protein